MEIQTDSFCKVQAAGALEICGRVELSDEAKALILPTRSPQGFLALLVQNSYIGDAVRFLAFALPKREAVWWACVTARSDQTQSTEAQEECLERAVAWVYEPTDAKRRICMEAAEDAQFEGAAAYAALAAFWSGGSLAPENMPEVLPDPSLAAIGVGASVLLAITDGDPKRLEERFEAAMQRGIDIANGGNGRLETDRPPRKVRS